MDLNTVLNFEGECADSSTATDISDGVPNSPDTLMSESSDHTEIGDTRYNWEQQGIPFIRRLCKQIDDQMSQAATKHHTPDFASHQKLWREFLTTLIEQLEDCGEERDQLTTPPIPAFEVELMDEMDLRGYCMGCPCGLHEDRNVEGRVFIVAENTGVTTGGFLRQLRETLYGTDDEARYPYLRDIFRGGVHIRSLTYMTSGGEIWPGMRGSRNRETALPTLFLACNGRRG